MGVALHPDPGWGQQDRDPQRAAPQPPGEILSHEDDDAQVTQLNYKTIYLKG